MALNAPDYNPILLVQRVHGKLTYQIVFYPVIKKEPLHEIVGRYNLTDEQAAMKVDDLLPRWDPNVNKPKIPKPPGVDTRD